MKTLTIIIIFSIGIASCNSNQSSENKDTADDSLAQNKSAELIYDSVLAKKYGADKYGMKKYIFAYLKQGPNRNQDSAEVAQIQKGHMENINRLADEGKLVLAGPFFDDTEIRGIFLFDVETLAEAEALINSDPAVKSGRLIMELHPWYGSAGLKAVTEIHRKISKENP